MNEGGGNTLENLVSGSKSILTSDFYWVTTKNGIVITGKTTTGAGIPVSIPLKVSSDWTCVFLINNFRDNGDAGQNANGILQFGSVNGTDKVLQITEVYGNKMVVGLYSDDKTFSYTKRINVFDMYAITHQKSKVLSVYRNGFLAAATQTTSGLLNPSGTSQIFANPLHGTYLKEYIVYLYFYWRALSPQEIQQLYIDPYCFIKQPSYRMYVPQGIVTAKGYSNKEVIMNGVGSGFGRGMR